MSEHNNNTTGLDNGAWKQSTTGNCSIPGDPAPGDLTPGDLTPGEKLRALREKRNISQAEVAQALHLTVHYVNALEHDQYDKMPGRVFVKGYFRNYAALLEADVDDIVSSYEKRAWAQESEQLPPIRPNVRKQPRHQDQSRYLLVGGALVITLFIALSWWFSGRSVGDPATAIEADYSAETAASTEVASTAIASTKVEREAETATAAALLAAAGGPNEQTVQDERITHLMSERSEQRIAPQQVAEQITETDEGPVQPEEAIAVTETASSPEPAVTPVPEHQDQVLADMTEMKTEHETSAATYETEQIAGNQVISLARTGDDMLDISLNGHSWVEVNDANDERLFGDLLTQGDELHIQARAPFDILVGDAHQVGIVFNRRKIELGRQIRSDNSARIILTP